MFFLSRSFWCYEFRRINEFNNREVKELGISTHECGTQVAFLIMYRMNEHIAHFNCLEKIMCTRIIELIQL